MIRAEGRFVNCNNETDLPWVGMAEFDRASRQPVWTSLDAGVDWFRQVHQDGSPGPDRKQSVDSWVYDVFSATTVARGLGTLEIVVATLISLRPQSARWSAVGSAMAIVLFCGTLSFLFTTPGVVSRFAGPIPVLSALPGQFLLKDVVLMGVAIWTLGEALQAHRAASALDADRDQVRDGLG